jgi:hypothetical protein
MWQFNRPFKLNHPLKLNPSRKDRVLWRETKAKEEKATREMNAVVAVAAKEENRRKKAGS